MPDPKLEEFRTNNVRLMQENSELTKQVEALTAQVARYGDVDPAIVAAERAELAELKKANPSARVAELEAALAAEKTARAAETQKVQAATIERLIGDAFLRVGGRPEARAFIVMQAAGLFALDDKGELRGTQFSAQQPGTPQSIDEWLSGVKTREHPYIFKTSSGSGADPKRGFGGIGHAGHVIRNPSPTELGRHSKEIAAGTIKVEYDE
jgi:hypothetical protein